MGSSCKHLVRLRTTLMRGLLSCRCCGKAVLQPVLTVYIVLWFVVFVVLLLSTQVQSQDEVLLLPGERFVRQASAGTLFEACGRQAGPGRRFSVAQYDPHMIGRVRVLESTTLLQRCFVPFFHLQFVGACRFRVGNDLKKLE